MTPALPTIDEIASDPLRARDLPPTARGLLMARCAAALAALSSAMVAGEGAANDVVERDDAGNNILLTVEEVAAMTRFAKSYVYELARRGELPSIRCGKYVRFRRSAILAWNSARERGGGVDEDGLGGLAGKAPRGQGRP